MMNQMRRALALCVCWLCLPYVYSYERILNWNSDITVQSDGSMRVIERIVVNAEGRKIKSGIKRSFPTQYKNKVGFRFSVPFTIEDVLLDGGKVPYKIVEHHNGITVYIGEKERFVSPGVHAYTIAYNTDKQLGFFDDYDQLYWNVTGIDNPFEVESASVQVRIPKTMLNGDKVSPHMLHIEAYTGSAGSQEQNYKASIGSDGVAYCATTQVLRPYEGLTIVVNWPKGVVEEYSRLWVYVKSNLHLVLLLFALLCVCGWYIGAYYMSRKQIKIGTVIPLFYPPDDADPGALRYVEKMGYDSKCLASNIVQMAVHGLLVIEHVPGKFFSNDHYILKKRQDVSVEATSLEAALMQILFGNSDTCSLLSVNQEKLNNAKTLVSNTYELRYAVDYFKSNSEYISIAVLISIVAGLLALGIVPGCYKDTLFIVLMGIHAMIHIVMSIILPNYSQAGQKFKEEIDGFKMFLGTTETERLKTVGTPPTQTPALYESYLPYAIALDVEEQWSHKFVPVFKHLEQIGQAYQPVWFNPGHPFMPSDLYFLGAGFGRSFDQALVSALEPIASSHTPPGSSSGSGGRGYSGGGGGGGGIGGW